MHTKYKATTFPVAPLMGLDSGSLEFNLKTRCGNIVWYCMSFKNTYTISLYCLYRSDPGLDDGWVSGWIGAGLGGGSHFR